MSAEGRLYWLMDGFTQSEMFPYARHYRLGDRVAELPAQQRQGGGGRLRREGHLLRGRHEDPIVAAYRGLFPSMFVDGAGCRPMCGRISRVGDRAGRGAVCDRRGGEAAPHHLGPAPGASARPSAVRSVRGQRVLNRAGARGRSTRPSGLRPWRSRRATMPPPARVPSAIVPECSCAICSTIASPSPEPGTSRAVVAR